MQTTDITPATIRAHFAALELPAELSLGPHAHIVDLPKFIDTQIERLESDIPIHRRLAFGALATVAEKINHPFPIG